MPRMIFFSILLCLVFSAIARAAPVAVVVDGPPVAGKIARIDAQWQITLALGEKTRVLPAAELVRWGAPVEVSRKPLLVLADGSLLPADVTTADREKLQADSLLFGKISLLLDAVAGIVFHPPSDRRRLDALLDRISGAESRTADRLLLSNGDELGGHLETIDENSVNVEADLGPLTLPTERITAVLLPRAAQPKPAKERQTWTGFRDGSRLLATGLLLETDRVQLTIAGKQTIQAPSEKLVWLQPLGDRITYLSEMKPTEYRHVPFLSLKWPYHTDRSVTGNWLRCGGQPYLKGLGVHSTATLSYTLPESYRRFAAELGVDEETAAGGSVQFRVLVDGREKFQSPIVRGGQPPVPVAVDIAGAKRLELVVDYADRGDEQDHADWLDARLVR